MMLYTSKYEEFVTHIMSFLERTIQVAKQVWK